MPIVPQSRLDWAKESEEVEPEIVENGLKKVIEYKTDENGKKFKVTNIFKVDRIKLPKSIAERKNLSKFGEAKSDPPGVNSSTTVIGDEVFMQFLTNKEEIAKAETAGDAGNNSGATIPKIQCRYCKRDHWTTKCPYKQYYEEMELRKAKDASDNGKKPEASTPAAAATAPTTEGAYVPPSRRAGATASSTTGKRYDSRMPQKEEYTVRVTNLPEEATDADLNELFKSFGKVTRVYLAKDRNTQQSKGFAFVTFQHKEDAQRAIVGVDNFGYHHLILRVEWAKPSTNQN